MNGINIGKQFSNLHFALRLCLLFVGSCALTALYVSQLSHNVNAAPVSTTYTANHSVILSGSIMGGPGGGVPNIFSDNMRFGAGSFGIGFSCFIADNLKIYCSGDNDDGALGDGTGNNQQLPVQFGAGVSLFDTTKFIQVSSAGGSVSGGHSCGLTTTKQIYCAGVNAKGELAIGGTAQQVSPILFGSLSGGGGGKLYTQVATGRDTTCGLATTQQIYCAGINLHGQLGAGLPTGSSIGYPTLQQFGPIAGKSFAKVAGGDSNTCAVTTTGEIYCAGRGTDGQLGRGSTVSSNVPVQFGINMVPAKTFVSVSVGTNAVCAVATDQQIYCAGKNGDGELGDGTIAIQRNNPVKFANLAASPAFGKNFTQVSTGGTRTGASPALAHTCGVTTEKQVYCAGSNDKYQLGYGADTADHPNPVLFGGIVAPTIGKTYFQVSTGEQFTCAFGTDELIYCVGENTRGALGNDSNDAQDFPDISMILQ